MTSDYGTYRLIFDPPSDQITPGVTMTLSGEATLDQMLLMFEGFLQASGYVLEGDLGVIPEDETPSPADIFTSWGDYWNDTPITIGSGTDFFSLGEK